MENVDRPEQSKDNSLMVRVQGQFLMDASMDGGQDLLGISK